MTKPERQTGDDVTPAETPVHAETIQNYALGGPLAKGVSAGRPRAVPYTVSGLTAAVAVVALTIAGHTPDTLRPIDASAGGEEFSPHKPVVALSLHLAALWAEMEEYRSLAKGWDGYGSVAPNPGVIDDALAFLRALPLTAPMPEPLVSADGSVGWFWKTAEKFVSVNFSRAGRFAYYGKVPGYDEARGAHAFDGEMLPQDLLDVILSA